MKKIALSIIGLVIVVSLNAQILGYPDGLYTKPERTQYQETSLHSDVMTFIQLLDAGSDLVYSEIIGTSKEGRDIPLVIMSNPGISTPQEAFSTGKPILYIQANIHGGEVEGKEASMIIMREMAFGKKKYLLDNQIVLFCPIYNADGNDALGPNNRSSQDGSPIEAGERYSGEGYDLNRDGLKLESIEGTALTENVMLRWKPLMFVDLHTTNGTWHGYSLTYAPGLNTTGHPGTTRYLMEELFPTVTEKVRERSGLDTYLYGNFSEFPPRTYNGMLTQPRYLTNALALRNMLTILVETFAHDRFERRILSNITWLTSMLEFTNDNADGISNLISNIENEVVQEIANSGGQAERGVRFQRGQLGPRSDLLVYDTETNIDQFGIERNRRTGRRYWVSGVKKMLGVDVTKTAIVPKAYVFSSDLENVADKLKQHGIPVIETINSRQFQGEEFTVTNFNQANNTYQGHRLTTVSGYFTNTSRLFPAGSYYVDMQHPLAYLAFYLLEPEADDGLTVWNYFDDFMINLGVRTQDVSFPVFKILEGGLSSGPDLLENDFSITNDPNTGILKIILPTNYEDTVELRLFDSSGKELAYKKSNPGETEILIQTDNPSSGIYLVRISTDKQQIQKKIYIN